MRNFLLHVLDNNSNVDNEFSDTEYVVEMVRGLAHLRIRDRDVQAQTSLTAFMEQINEPGYELVARPRGQTDDVYKAMFADELQEILEAEQVELDEPPSDRRRKGSVASSQDYK